MSLKQIRLYKIESWGDKIESGFNVSESRKCKTVFQAFFFECGSRKDPKPVPYSSSGH